MKTGYIFLLVLIVLALGWVNRPLRITPPVENIYVPPEHMEEIHSLCAWVAAGFEDRELSAEVYGLCVEGVIQGEWEEDNVRWWERSRRTR
jgi:hypothetical protein